MDTQREKCTYSTTTPPLSKTADIIMSLIIISTTTINLYFFVLVIEETTQNPGVVNNREQNTHIHTRTPIIQFLAHAEETKGRRKGPA